MIDPSDYAAGVRFGFVIGVLASALVALWMRFAAGIR